MIAPHPLTADLAARIRAHAARCGISDRDLDRRILWLKMRESVSKVEDGFAALRIALARFAFAIHCARDDLSRSLQEGREK